MKAFTTLPVLPGSGILLFGLVSFLLCGCAVDAAEPITIDHSVITSFEVTPVSPAKSPHRESYLLELRLAPTDDHPLPPAVSLLSSGGDHRKHRIALVDDGTAGDRSAHDRTYSAIVDVSWLPLGAGDGADKTSALKLECDVDIVRVGQECLNWGTCPSESLLGGPTWFCVCVEKCTIKWE